MDVCKNNMGESLFAGLGWAQQHGGVIEGPKDVHRRAQDGPKDAPRGSGRESKVAPGSHMELKMDPRLPHGAQNGSQINIKVLKKRVRKSIAPKVTKKSRLQPNLG